MSILGQRTKQLMELDIKANEHKEDVDTKSRGTWNKRNKEGFGSVHASMQQPDAPKHEPLIGMRIEYLSIIDMDKAGSETNVLWMGGIVERVSDGNWLIPGQGTNIIRKARRKKYIGMRCQKRTIHQV